MDKIFQKFCDFYPHYKIKNKSQKKFFYFIFLIFRLFIKGPFKLNFGNFFLLAYPQKKNYSRHMLKKVALHDHKEVNFFVKNIDSNSIFLDCGANQGFYSIPIAASNKDCSVIAFEPSDQEMEYLNQNIAINKLKNIKTSFLGIGDKEGIYKFKNDNLEIHSTKGGVIVDNIEENNVKIIKVTTLDKFIKENRPEINKATKIFIKIDIEGFDINAIYGSKDIIKNYFTVISVEFSKMAVANEIYSKDGFSKFLSENNLIILDILGKEHSLEELHLLLDNLKGNHQVCGNFLIVNKNLIENLVF